jgi:NADPH-dependent curcumin reductase
MTETHRQILMKRRPEGMPTEEDFETVERPRRSPGPGEVLRRTLYLSVDPYMRGRMNAGKSYAASVEPGQVMVGATVSQVVESADPAFPPGAFVLGYDGWQSHAVSDGKGLRILDPTQAPLSYALGVLGMPGLTAYVGVLDIGRPKGNETVVVSAAAGAVGSIAGQIAKIKGCRVVGLAGSKEKCDYVTGELGFDACIDYRREELLPALKAACPNGIDVYVENVGGAVLEAVLRHLNVGARIPLIGLIAQYNETTLPPGPNWVLLLVSRALVQGMIVGDHVHRMPDFLRDVAQWLREGRIRYREDVVVGLENAPRAFLGLFRGENVGKRIVRLADDPTRG